MAKKQKYYVVWRGKEPGIYTSWDECERQVKGAEKALYKSFTSLAEAEKAYASDPYFYITPPQRKPERESGNHRTEKGLANPPDYRNDTVLPLPLEVKAEALAVDAACSGNPGKMEYRGVDLRTGQTVFHFGPVYGTNNIGEFLAIVHGMALLHREGRKMTIYSDSRNAMLWVKAGKCKTRLARTARTETLFQLIERAENWLLAHKGDYMPLLKWDTSRWGEIPADFGRK